MSPPGHVLACDFLSLEARKQQLEARTWESISKIRVQHAVEEQRRSFSVGMLERRIDACSQEQARTLQRNEVIRHQCATYQQQAVAQVPQMANAGSGRVTDGEFGERVRDQRDAFVKQTERMACQYQAVVEDQLRQEIQAARIDSAHCEARQNELLQAACRQKQLLEELHAERQRALQERCKFYEIDSKVQERQREMRAQLEQENLTTDRVRRQPLDQSAKHTNNDQVAEPCAAAVDASNCDASHTRKFMARVPLEAQRDSDPSKTKTMLTTDIASAAMEPKKEYVPPMGSRQFEVYQRLKTYESEMLSDLRVLEGLPAPSPVFDIGLGNERNSRLPEVVFNSNPCPPLVVVGAAHSSSLTLTPTNAGGMHARPTTVMQARPLGAVHEGVASVERQQAEVNLQRQGQAHLHPPRNMQQHDQVHLPQHDFEPQHQRPQQIVEQYSSHHQLPQQQEQHAIQMAQHHSFQPVAPLQFGKDFVQNREYDTSLAGAPLGIPHQLENVVVPVPTVQASPSAVGASAPADVLAELSAWAQAPRNTSFSNNSSSCVAGGGSSNVFFDADAGWPALLNEPEACAAIGISPGSPPTGLLGDTHTHKDPPSMSNEAPFNTTHAMQSPSIDPHDSAQIQDVTTSNACGFDGPASQSRPSSDGQRPDKAGSGTNVNSIVDKMPKGMHPPSSPFLSGRSSSLSSKVEVPDPSAASKPVAPMLSSASDLLPAEPGLQRNTTADSWAGRTTEPLPGESSRMSPVETERVAPELMQGLQQPPVAHSLSARPDGCASPANTWFENSLASCDGEPNVDASAIRSESEPQTFKPLGPSHQHTEDLRASARSDDSIDMDAFIPFSARSRQGNYRESPRLSPSEMAAAVKSAARPPQSFEDALQDEPMEGPAKIGSQAIEASPNDTSTAVAAQDVSGLSFTFLPFELQTADTEIASSADRGLPAGSTRASADEAGAILNSSAPPVDQPRGEEESFKSKASQPTAASLYRQSPSGSTPAQPSSSRRNGGWRDDPNSSDSDDVLKTNMEKSMPENLLGMSKRTENPLAKQHAGYGSGLRAGLVQDQAAAPKMGPPIQSGPKAIVPKATLPKAAPKSSPAKALAPKAQASPGLRSGASLGLDSDDDDDDDELLPRAKPASSFISSMKGLGGLGRGSLRLGRAGAAGRGRGTGGVLGGEIDWSQALDPRW